MVSNTSEGQSPSQRTRTCLPTVAGCSMLAPSPAHFAAHDCEDSQGCEHPQDACLASAAKKACMGLPIVPTAAQLLVWPAHTPQRPSKQTAVARPYYCYHRESLGTASGRCCSQDGSWTIAYCSGSTNVSRANCKACLSHRLHITLVKHTQDIPSRPHQAQHPQYHTSSTTCRDCLQCRCDAFQHVRWSHMAAYGSQSVALCHRSWLLCLLLSACVECIAACRPVVSITGCFLASWPAVIPLRYLMCASCVCVHTPQGEGP
jgi:hypothetical protein